MNCTYIRYFLTNIVILREWTLLEQNYKMFGIIVLLQKKILCVESKSYIEIFINQKPEFYGM